jgi:hypothetical protein
VGSIAREGRSLHVDRHVDVELTQGGQHDIGTSENSRDGMSGEASGGVIQ